MTMRFDGFAMTVFGVAASTLLVACCPDPKCPNPPNAEAYVPDAKHRVTLTALDDAGLDQVACFVQSNDGPACVAGTQPPVCDKRAPEVVKASLRPAFEQLRGYKLTSPTTAVNELRLKLPKSGDPLVTTAVWDARRDRDCTSKKGGACVAVRWHEVWMLLHADAEGAVTSVDVFANQRLCDADVDQGDAK